MSEITTSAPLPTGLRSDGNRSQSTLENAFPGSPIHGAGITYTVAPDEDGTYTLYQRVLINEVQAADRDEAKTHWSFDSAQDVSLGYEGAPGLFPPPAGIHYGFAPNLLPPGIGSQLLTDKGDNAVFVAPPGALTPGRKLPIQPDQTSNQHNRSEKPNMIPTDSAGTSEYEAETIPAQEDPPAAANQD